MNMNSPVELKKEIFSIENEEDFERIALQIFQYQSVENETYKNYLLLLGKKAETIRHTAEIPFLPISFFKSNKIISGDNPTSSLYFESSGTTQNSLSRHYVPDPEVYRHSLIKGFTSVYGKPEDYVFLALLPTYLDNPHSSLIYMMDQLMKQSNNSLSGYYKDNFDGLAKQIQVCKSQNKKIFLWGVTYALLSFADFFQDQLTNDDVLLETGGMKGKGKELVREELHSILKHKFGVKTIHSEYGMTELLSQAYSTDSIVFHSPPWMRIYIRDVYDPFQMMSDSQTGAINVIDLANIHSCSFIATDDLGKKNKTGFEVLGRIDYSDIRGCNLLI